MTTVAVPGRAASAPQLGVLQSGTAPLLATRQSKSLAVRGDPTTRPPLRASPQVCHCPQGRRRLLEQLLAAEPHLTPCTSPSQPAHSISLHSVPSPRLASRTSPAPPILSLAKQGHARCGRRRSPRARAHRAAAVTASRDRRASERGAARRGAASRERCRRGGHGFCQAVYILHLMGTRGLGDFRFFGDAPAARAKGTDPKFRSPPKFGRKEISSHRTQVCT
eukprot:scaffold926_cov408-Prasinococcus_capsulatus_cf.AAC.21